MTVAVNMESAIKSSVEHYLKMLASQSSAGIHMSSAFSNFVSKQEQAKPYDNPEDISRFEASVLDQSYISLKLQNAFDEVEQQLDACKRKVKSRMSLSWRKGAQKKDGKDDQSSTGKEVTFLVLALVKELYEYHKAVSEHLAPLVEFSVREKYSEKHEAKECSSVPVAWKAVSEITRSLRYGYGLSNQELSNILAWMHGEDLSESTRKLLNQKVDSLIHTYEEKMMKFDTYEVDVPIAFHIYPMVLQDVLKDCCNSVESRAAIGQNTPSTKEDLETLIHREIPRIQVEIGGTEYDVSNPGKAFENTKQKMHAVRDLVSGVIQSQKVAVNKEQLDLFCLRVLATACVSVSNAASRTAVLMAFGKANLVQVKPFSSKPEELRPAQICANGGAIEIDVPSQWWIVEDGSLFASLCRDAAPVTPLAMVETTYRLTMDLTLCLEKKIEPLPVVHLRKISTLNTQSSKITDVKDNNAKNLRKRLSKATSKLFNRRSFTGLPQKLSGKQDNDESKEASSQESVYAESKEHLSDNDEEKQPVPPPRPRRKARKKKKIDSVKKVLPPQEEAKKDKGWFASSPSMFKPHLVPKVKVDSKASPSVASFEELQEVIEFLSGSSTSSLCLSQAPEPDKGAVVKVTQKERDSQTSTDDKGKTSPVDSGIGSSMSVQSSLSTASTLSVQSHPSGTPSSCRKKRKTKGCEGKDKDKLKRDELNQMLPESPEDDDTETSEHDGKATDKQTQNLGTTSSSCDENKEMGSNTASEQRQRTEKALVDMEVNEYFNSMTETVSGNTSSDVSDSKDVSVRNDRATKSSAEDFRRKSTVEPLDVETAESTEEIYRKSSHEGVQDGSEAASVGPPSPDQQSYDADGSDEGDDSTTLHEDNDESKHGSNNTLRGSTESLYYSAWSLQDISGPSDKDLAKDGSPRPALTETETIESMMEASVDKLTSEKEEMNENSPSAGEIKREMPQDSAEYKPFNSRFSWSAEIGNRLAAIWGGGKETTEPVVSTQGGIWSSGDTAMTVDKQMDLQNLLEGSSWSSTERPSSTPSLPWKARSPNEASKGTGSSPTVATGDHRWVTPSTTTRYGDVWQQDPRHTAVGVSHHRETQPCAGVFHHGSSNLPVGHRGWSLTQDSRRWPQEYPQTNLPFSPTLTPARPQSTPSLHIPPGRNAPDFDQKTIPRVPSPGFGIQAGPTGLAMGQSVHRGSAGSVSRYPEHFPSQSGHVHLGTQSSHFRPGHRRHSSDVMVDPSMLAQMRAQRNTRMGQYPGAWNQNKQWPQ